MSDSRSLLARAVEERLRDALDLADCIGDTRPHQIAPVWGVDRSEHGDADSWVEYAAEVAVGAVLDAMSEGPLHDAMARAAAEAIHAAQVEGATDVYEAADAALSVVALARTYNEEG